MKALVVYFSQTGNTKRVAEAIFEAISCDKEIADLTQIASVDESDLIFVGFPIQAFGPAAEAKQFIEKHCQNRKVALFMTHGVPEGFKELATWVDACKEGAARADLIGVFECQGEVAQVFLDAALQSDDPLMQKFGEAGATSKGKPDALPHLTSPNSTSSDPARTASAPRRP